MAAHFRMAHSLLTQHIPGCFWIFLPTTALSHKHFPPSSQSCLAWPTTTSSRNFPSQSIPLKFSSRPSYTRKRIVALSRTSPLSQFIYVSSPLSQRRSPLYLNTHF